MENMDARTYLAELEKLESDLREMIAQDGVSRDTKIKLIGKLAEIRPALNEERAYRERQDGYIRDLSLYQVHYDRISELENNLEAASQAGLEQEYIDILEDEKEEALSSFHQSIGDDSIETADEIKAKMDEIEFEMNKFNGLVDESVAEKDRETLQRLSDELESIREKDELAGRQIPGRIYRRKFEEEIKPLLEKYDIDTNSIRFDYENPIKKEDLLNMLNSRIHDIRLEYKPYRWGDVNVERTGDVPAPEAAPAPEATPAPTATHASATPEAGEPGTNSTGVPVDEEKKKLEELKQKMEKFGEDYEKLEEIKGKLREYRGLGRELTAEEKEEKQKLNTQRDSIWKVIVELLKGIMDDAKELGIEGAEELITNDNRLNIKHKDILEDVKKKIDSKIAAKEREAKPGTPAPGTPAPGTPAPGTPAPGTPAPGTPAPRTPAPGTPAPGTPAPGTPARRTAAPGTPAPRTPAPGTQARRTPAPGTPAPGTPASVRHEEAIEDTVSSNIRVLERMPLAMEREGQLFALRDKQKIEKGKLYRFEKQGSELVYVEEDLAPILEDPKKSLKREIKDIRKRIEKEYGKEAAKKLIANIAREERSRWE